MVIRTTFLTAAFIVSGSAAFADFQTSDCLILPGASVDLGGTVPGLIAEVNGDIGDAVQEGQVVASLRTEVQETLQRLTRHRAANQSALTAAQIQFDYELAEFDRIENLRERGVATEAQFLERQTTLALRESELEDARAQVREAEIDVERAAAELEVRRIRSPISGVIADRYLDGGEYLRDDGRVVTIVQLDPLRVEVFLPQAAYTQVVVGNPALVVPELGAQGPFEAKIVNLDPMIDAASATFRIRLSLPNPEGSIISGVRCAAVFPGVDPSDG